ncbi:hypothetical protein [Streptomyces peucetius]|uniref:Secreted protein n=1 Tax=Streptomyces peucetius TaxID=1950 RepID=A0ABY6I7A1_STRPE|nr:hypothetical protein [Streptomyces peucetius]UYQ61852.1 hypothetical protein OGH68_10330 [Streptomyces peucetius]
MSTLTSVLIVVAVVAVLLIIAGALYARRRSAHGGGRRALHRRFGPEYDRVLARHDGDAKATDRELQDRVRRHGDLTPRPLAPGVREQYDAEWAAVQERFVDSPRRAVADADQLLGRLAADRGFPDAGRYEDQLAALSVHHPRHIEGYREVHRAARADSGASTEGLREAMVDARELFDDLVADRAVDHGRHRPGHGQSQGRGHGRGHLLRPRGSGA